jgi:hypothetical protein
MTAPEFDLKTSVPQGVTVELKKFPLYPHKCDDRIYYDKRDKEDNITARLKWLKTAHKVKNRSKRMHDLIDKQPPSFVECYACRQIFLVKNLERHKLKCKLHPVGVHRRVFEKVMEEELLEEVKQWKKDKHSENEVMLRRPDIAKLSSGEGTATKEKKEETVLKKPALEHQGVQGQRHYNYKEYMIDFALESETTSLFDKYLLKKLEEGVILTGTYDGRKSELEKARRKGKDKRHERRKQGVIKKWIERRDYEDEVYRKVLPISEDKRHPLHIPSIKFYGKHNLGIPKDKTAFSLRKSRDAQRNDNLEHLGAGRSDLIVEHEIDSKNPENHILVKVTPTKDLKCLVTTDTDGEHLKAVLSQISCQLKFK